MEDDSVASCDPWPEGGARDCPLGEAHFPGEPDCAPLGSSCPDGNWSEDIPTDREVLYVLAGASAGGAGTRESPFGSIAEALDAASAETVVALSRGTFDESVELPGGGTLWGACVTETVVTSSAPSTSAGTVTVRGRDTVVRNLRVTGARPGFWVGGGGTSVTIEDVAVMETEFLGLAVFSGGRATVRNVLIADTASATDGSAGRGLIIQDGGQVELSRVAFERNREVGISLSGELSTIVLSDVVVRDTLGRASDDGFGRGMSIQSGASAVVNRASFSRNRDISLVVSEAGSTLELNDVWITDTACNYVGVRGWGLSVEEGGNASLTSVVFQRNRNVSISIFGSGTTASLAELVVSETAEQASDDWLVGGLRAMGGAEVAIERAVFLRNEGVGVVVVGAGTTGRVEALAVRDTRARATVREGEERLGMALLVSEGAEAEVTQALLERSATCGADVQDEGTSLVLTDVVVRDGLSPGSDMNEGFGIAVHHTAQLELSRALFERNHLVAVFASDPGTVMVATDLILRDTEHEMVNSTSGHGLYLKGGARVDVVRAVIERSRDAAVIIGQVGTTVTLADLEVRDTTSRGRDGEYGRGLEIILGAQVDLQRAIVEDNMESNIAVRDPGTVATMQDILVRNARPAACSETSECPGFGDGIVVARQASLEVSRFIVTGNDRCGVTVDDSEVDLHHGEVTNNTIGACIRAEDLDLNRLMDEVVYRDNERRLDPNFRLPVPESLEFPE